MEVGFAFISAVILIVMFVRTPYLINWKAFLPKLVNQEANFLLLLHGTDLPIKSQLFSDLESFVAKLDAERKEYYLMG